MEYIKALIKFSQKDEYRQDLINGKLFFNSIENVRAVNDPFDSYMSRVNLGDVNVMVLDRPNSLKPIMCFYAIIDNIPTNSADIKITRKDYEKLRNSFGDYVTIIKDVPKFIELIKQAPFSSFYGCCDYSGVDLPLVPIFNKKNDFSIEHEFRILLDNIVIKSEKDDLVFDYYKDFFVADKCLFLNIPSLADITETCNINEILAGKKAEVSFDESKNRKTVLSNLDNYLKESD